MSTPRPGKPARGSTTGRPIMALLDLLGRRWVLRILWELRDDALGFRELQARCDGMSSSVLAARLVDMGAAGIVTKGDDDRYALTDEGRALLDALGGLNHWAERWARRMGESD